MSGRLASLWRYPVKGFTPERVRSATLEAGAFFPSDRIFAVEDGPSGFDPAAPAWISKQKFTVLAKIAQVARARTVYDEESGLLTAHADGRPEFRGRLTDGSGRVAFAAWLTDFLGDEVSGPLKVVEAPGHRFTDDPAGYVSVVNLASVRDLEAKTGRAIDSLRLRANLYVEGWPAWFETSLVGRSLGVGAAQAHVFSPIVRCAATHVDPTSGERDFDLVRALHDNFGHLHCGIYVSIREGGLIGDGDPITLLDG